MTNSRIVRLFGREARWAVRRGLALATLTAALLWTFSTAAQVITGSVSGTVTDSTGAVIPGVSVVLTNQATNVKSTITTGSGGEYGFGLLPIGVYTVSGSKEGFRTSTSAGIRVSAGSTIRVDLPLEVGAVAQKVEVQGVAPALQTDSAQVSNAVEGRMIRELPIPGRDLLRLSMLGPGVIQRQTSSILTLTDSYLGSSFPTIAGGRGESISFTLGGINENNRRLNLPMEKPSLDAIEEFKVLANDYTAEYGQGDGQIVVEFRSGTNKLHGSAYEFLRNDALNARDFFDVTKPPLRYNEFGGAVGGPIVKNHAFFFANYEGTRNPSSQTQGGLFPTAAMLNGDFSNLRDKNGNVIPIYDPSTTDPVTGQRQQFPGNMIPPGRISSIATSMFKILGAPTAASFAPGGSNNVTAVVPKTFTVDQLSVKIDHYFARGDAISTRYTFTDPRNFSGNITRAAQGTSDGRNQIMSQSWTHTFGPTLLNEFRAGYVRQRAVSVASLIQSGLQKAVGITNPLPFDSLPTVFLQSTTGTASFNQLNGVNGADTGSSGEVQQFFQFVDNVSWVRGAHSFKFGGDYRRRRWDTIGLQLTGGGSIRNGGNFTSALQPDPANPGFFTPVQGTGSPLADFLLGQITGVDFGLGRNIFSYRDNVISWFGQDTWRITPRLTLLLGLRWDYQSPISEKHGKESWFISDSRCPAGCLVNDGQFGGVFDPIVNPFPGKPAIRNGGINPDYTNFAPRISLAYRWHERTVIRAGYGVFYSIYDQNNFPGATNPPFGSGYLINSAINDGASSLGTALANSKYPLNTIYPNVVPAVGQTQPGTLGLGFYYDIHNVTPQLINTSFALQHAFTPSLTAEMGYLGKFGRHMSQFTSIDQCTTVPCTLDPATGKSIKRFPNFSSVALITTDGSMSYNAGYIKVEKRYSKGLTFLGSWTWSRDLTTGGDSEGNDIFLGSAGGLFNFRNVPKHLSVLDATHRVVISGLYELPFGRGKAYANNTSRALDLLVGGWQTTWVTAFQSGLALDLSSFGAAHFVPGDESKLKRMDFRTTGYFFDPNLFTSGPGDPIPYTAFRGAGINNWDISVFKNFRITESQRLQFRTEMYNVWNHAQFEVPGHVTFFPGFGKFQAVNPGFFERGSRSPRNIELALKYEF